MNKEEDFLNENEKVEIEIEEVKIETEIEKNGEIEVETENEEIFLPVEEKIVGENLETIAENELGEILDRTAEEEAEGIAIIEAVVFMYGEPVSFSRLAEILEIDEEEVAILTGKLKDIYDDRPISGLRILIDEKKVQLVTHPNCAETINEFVKSELNKSLSQSALEVLAIIAYRGPISKADIEAIRGVNCSFTLRNLLTRDLIEKVADENNSRTNLYKTTFKFLRSLGIENEKDLPDFEKLVNDKRIDAILYSGSELVQK